MTTFSTFAARDLAERDAAAARALAVAHGVHGAYVWNALETGEGESLALWHGDELRGLCWFGSRGNLIVLAEPDLDAARVAAAVQRARRSWRIALGPAAVVDALAALCAGKPLVHRDQVYYSCAPAEAAPAFVDARVRAPERADRDRLMQATLELNEEDLHVAPARVDRRWLRDTVDERIAESTSRVIGPVGAPDCKVDFGSEGPGGLLLEGVFTFPAARGRGLATRLVATAVAHAKAPRVCLHVAVHNARARAAYERAGMREAGRCRLLLL